MDDACQSNFGDVRYRLEATSTVSFLLRVVIVHELHASDGVFEDPFLIYHVWFTQCHYPIQYSVIRCQLWSRRDMLQPSRANMTELKNQPAINH